MQWLEIQLSLSLLVYFFFKMMDNAESTGFGQLVSHHLKGSSLLHVGFWINSTSKLVQSTLHSTTKQKIMHYYHKSIAVNYSHTL